MREPIRLGVAGSRHWTDEWLLRNVLDAINGGEVYIGTLIHGGAVRKRPIGREIVLDGADWFASKWAHARYIEEEVIRPVYEGSQTSRRYAPLTRNTQIVERSDRIVAFRAPGKSNGTDDCVRKAKAAGKLWLVITEYEVRS